MARPSPLDPPVTTTVLPSRSGTSSAIQWLAVIVELLSLIAGTHPGARRDAGQHSPNQHVLSLGYALPSTSTAIAALLIHAVAMLAVAGVLATVVYETVGVGILRRAWVNLDLPWAASLVGAGLLMAAL